MSGFPDPLQSQQEPQGTSGSPQPQLTFDLERLRKSAARISKGIPTVVEQQSVEDYKSSRDITGVSWLDQPLRFGAAIGTGIVDSTLGLASGAAGLIGMTGAFPRSWKEALPKDVAERLENNMDSLPGPAKTAGEIVGQVAAFTAGAPGKVVTALGAPGFKLGKALAERIPQASAWGKVAAGLLPATVSSSTGFGLYNYLSQEGGLEERATALGHGMVMGAGLGVLGTLGRQIENNILARGLRPGQIEAMTDVALGLRDPSTLKVGMIHRFLGRSASTMMEGTGFAGMSADWWGDVFAGIGGDQERMSNATAVWFGSVGGVVAAHYGRPDAYLHFQRTEPGLNSLLTRIAAEQIREAEVKREKGLNQYQEPVQPGRIEREKAQETAAAEERDQAWQEKKQRADAAMVFERTAGSVADTLFRSGWRETQDSATPIISRVGNATEMELHSPGLEPIVLRDNAGQLEITVPQSVYQIVRQAGDPGTYGSRAEGDVTLVGDAAKQFAGEVALHSIFRRLQGEALFGSAGMKEIGAGMGWHGPDGREHQIGLDGQHVSRSLPPQKGEKWRREEPLPTPDAPMAMGREPQLLRWQALVDTFGQVNAPSRELDVLKAAVFLARYGDPKSPSVQGVQELLASPLQQGVMNADLLAPILTPANLDLLAWHVGSVGSGHSNPGIAREGILLGLGQSPVQPVAKAEGIGGIQAPLVDRVTGRQAAPTPKPSESGQNPSESGVSGTESKLPAMESAKDWRTVPKEEARAGAEDYVRAAVQEGKEVAPARLGDVFGLPRRTARDLIERVTAEEPKTEDLGPSEVSGGTIPKAVGEAIKGTGKAVGKAYVEQYSGTEPVEVGRAGGEKGAEFGARAREGFDITRKLRGAIHDIRHEAHVAMSKKGVKEFLQRTVKVDGQEVLYRTELMHGRPVGEDVPPDVADAIKKEQALVLATGKQAEAAGVLRYDELKPTDKEIDRWEPFTASPEGKIEPRLRGEDWNALVTNDGGRKALAEWLADANPLPNVPRETRVKAIEEVLKPGDVKVKAAEHEAAFESFRRLRRTPDVFTYEGKPYKLTEPDPSRAIERIANQETARVATIRAYGQDLPKDVREKFGRERPGITESLAGYKGALSKAEFEAGFGHRAEMLAERLQGRNPESNTWLFRTKLGRMIRGAENMRRSIQTFTAFTWDLADPANVVGSLLGYQRLYAAIKKLGVPGTEAFMQTLSEAHRMGSLLAKYGDMVLTEADGAMAKVADIIRIPGRATESWKQLVVHVAAKDLVTDLASGEMAGRKDIAAFLKAMDFTSAESAAMLRGDGGKLYDTLVRRSVAKMTGNYLAGEGSRAHASTAFNFYLPYNRFFMGRFELAHSMFRAIQDPATRREGMKMGAKFLLGSAAAGTFGQYVAYLLQTMSFEESAKKWWRELSMAPVQFLGGSALSQVLGGSAFNLASSLLRPGQPENPAVTLSRVVGPIQPLVETISAATNYGAYANSTMNQKLWTLAERLPAVPRVATQVFAAAGFGEGPFLQAHRDLTTAKRKLGMPVGGGAGVDEENVPFTIATRDLDAVLRENFTKGNEVMESAVKDLVQNALKLGTGQDLAATLRGKKMMTGVSDDRAKRIEDMIGSDQLALIYSYDAALEHLASTYSKEKGSPKHAERPAGERISNVVHQVKLGSVDAWGPLFEDILSHDADAVVAGAREIGPEVKALAQAAAALPETLRRVLTDREFKALQGTDRGRVGMLLERILSGKVIEMAKNRAREAK